MWKIALGVALGIVLAGIITTAGWMLFTGAVLKGLNDTFKQLDAKPLKIVPIGSNTHQNQSVDTSSAISDPMRNMVIDPSKASVNQLGNAMSRELLRGTTIGKQIEKRELVIENSQKAYKQARNDVSSFKAQYKKPPECHDMKDDATRIYCANEFIRARKAYEALNN